ncbi:MAG: D-alanine--D-alanine ligase [bacterium]|nr:D-alanine--D-alanine ligase [bacterium]
MRVLVLCGGASSERNVSYASGDSVATWVAALGHEVWKYDPEQIGHLFTPDHKLSSGVIGTDAPEPGGLGGFDARVVRGLLDTIERQRIEFVFPILHGGYGEDGTVQSLLEWVAVPYAGSGPRSCAVAMHKPTAKHLMSAANVPVPQGFAVEYPELADTERITQRIAREFGFPAIIKPQSGGSTIGLTIAKAEADVPGALEQIRAQRDGALIEKLFAGSEIAATVIDGQAFPLVEIRPKEGFYDYANKYTAGRTEYICPAELPAEVTNGIQRAAERAFQALDARGFARVDFLVHERDFVCLELNSLPGMTATSLVPKAARAHGWSAEELIGRIMDRALNAVADRRA